MTLLQKIENFFEDVLCRPSDASFVVVGFGEFASVHMFDRPATDEDVFDAQCDSEIDPTDYMMALGL